MISCMSEFERKVIQKEIDLNTKIISYYIHGTEEIAPALKEIELNSIQNPDTKYAIYLNLTYKNTPSSKEVEYDGEGNANIIYPYITLDISSAVIVWVNNVAANCNIQINCSDAEVYVASFTPIFLKELPFTEISIYNAKKVDIISSGDSVHITCRDCVFTKIVSTKTPYEIEDKYELEGEYYNPSFNDITVENGKVNILNWENYLSLKGKISGIISGITGTSGILCLSDIDTEKGLFIENCDISIYNKNKGVIEVSRSIINNHSYSCELDIIAKFYSIVRNYTDKKLSILLDDTSFLFEEKRKDVFAPNNILTRARFISPNGLYYKAVEETDMIGCYASLYNNDFIYQIGKCVEEENLDTNENVICGSGINMFADLTKAIEYSINQNSNKKIAYLELEILPDSKIVTPMDTGIEGKVRTNKVFVKRAIPQEELKKNICYKNFIQKRISRWTIF